MENKQTVLVTAIGSFAADTVIRELKEAGYRVIGSDIYDPKWVAASQDVEAFYQAPLAKDEKKYIDFIKDGEKCIGCPIFFFFKLNSTEMTENAQMINIDEIAKIMKKFKLRKIY